MKKYFGEIKNSEVRLTREEIIVNEEWQKTAQLRNYIVLDDYIVMPNHFHGIIAIEKFESNLQNETPQRGVCTGHKLIADSLGSIINQFKGKCTKRIKEFNSSFSWKERFHDRIIRNETELNNVRGYIRYNPLKWDEDEYYI